MCPRVKKCKTGGWVKSLNLAARYPKLRNYLEEKRKKNKTGGILDNLKAAFNKHEKFRKENPKAYMDMLNKTSYDARQQKYKQDMFNRYKITLGSYHRKRKQTCRRRRR